MADVKFKKPDGTWISLKGPQGETGATGADGNDGAPGSPGVNGTSVTVYEQAGEPGSAIIGDFWIEP
jgi:hypothetical protein